jgi:hypothetical protein
MYVRRHCEFFIQLVNSIECELHLGGDSMAKDQLILVIISGFLVGIAGFVMLFFNVYFATTGADAWLANRGGADTGLFHIVVKGYMNTFLVGGGILFVMGMVAVVLGYHQLQVKRLSE